MAIKFPCRKHLVNYIGCHITGTIYSSVQIRWITFALELKNIWCILILLKHSQNQPSWCKIMWKYIWSIFTIHSGFGCEWQPSQISCFQKCKKFHVEIPNSCKTIQYVQFGTSASMFGFDHNAIYIYILLCSISPCRSIGGLECWWLSKPNWEPKIFPKADLAITTLGRISLLYHEKNRGGNIFWQKSREHSAKSVSVKSRKASSLFLSLSTSRSITCILVNKKHPLWKESK